MQNNPFLWIGIADPDPPFVILSFADPDLDPDRIADQ